MTNTVNHAVCYVEYLHRQFWFEKISSNTKLFEKLHRVTGVEVCKRAICWAHIQDVLKIQFSEGIFYYEFYVVLPCWQVNFHCDFLLFHEYYLLWTIVHQSKKVNIWQHRKFKQWQNIDESKKSKISILISVASMC